jgi:aspartate aminotransferase
VSRRIQEVYGRTAPVLAFLTESTWARRQGEPGISDFVVGNPHEMPLPSYVEALRRQIEPRSADWFAYKMSEPVAQEAVAASLNGAFEPQDIILTTGAFAGLTVALKTLVDAGDEVIFISPPWFFYETLIVAEGAVPVRVRVNAADFDLNLDAIEAAITSRTRAIIVNSPNNPTGRIYPASTLEALSKLLTRASETHGRPIYLLADEAYRRIVYDGSHFVSPAEFYPHTIVIYTYGKTLLTPGQRIGYLALPPLMPAGERAQLRSALTLAQVVTGYAFPNALLQHALPELTSLSIDVGHLQRKRDRLVSALRGLGYDVHVPEATFYLLPKAPVSDDLRFVEALTQHNVFVLPGTAVELPGYFRISLTATDAMIDRALPGFAAAFNAAHLSPARNGRTAVH